MYFRYRLFFKEYCYGRLNKTDMTDKDIKENKISDDADEELSEKDKNELDELGIKLNFPDEPEEHAKSAGENGPVSDNVCAAQSHKSLRKKTFVFFAFATTAAVCILGIIIYRYRMNPKRELISEMEALSEGIKSFDSPLITKLADKDHIEMLEGMTRSDISLNVSNTDSWPVTVGVDGAVIRNGDDGSVSADAELSVSNTNIIRTDLYADKKEICISFPDISNDYFGVSPQHLGDQYNDSMFADMTGKIPNDFSIPVYTAKDLTEDRADYAGIVSEMKISDVSEDGERKIYTVSLGDDSLRKIDSALSGYIRKISYLSETGALLYGENSGFKYENVSFQKPCADIKITLDKGRIIGIVFYDLLFSDKKGDTLEIPELSADFVYSDNNGTSATDGGLSEAYVSGHSDGKDHDTGFTWSVKTKSRNVRDGSSDHTAEESFDYVMNGINATVKVSDDEFSDEGRAVASIISGKGNENALLVFDGIFDSDSVDCLKLKISDLSYTVTSEKVFKVTGNVEISSASENEKPVNMDGYSGNRMDLSKMSCSELQSWLAKTSDDINGREKCWNAWKILQVIMERLGTAEGSQ